jgi:hypothetical protein
MAQMIDALSGTTSALSEQEPRPEARSMAALAGRDAERANNGTEPSSNIHIAYVIIVRSGHISHRRLPGYKRLPKAPRPPQYLSAFFVRLFGSSQYSLSLDKLRGHDAVFMRQNSASNGHRERPRPLASWTEPAWVPDLNGTLSSSSSRGTPSCLRSG